MHQDQPHIQAEASSYRTNPGNMDKPYFPETPDRGWKKALGVLVILLIWLVSCWQFQAHFQADQTANFSKQEEKGFDWRPIPYQTHKL